MVWLRYFIDGRDVCIFSRTPRCLAAALAGCTARKSSRSRNWRSRQTVAHRLVRLHPGRSRWTVQYIFRNNILASSVIPQIVDHRAAAGGQNLPALTDFVIMVDQTDRCSSPGPTSSRPSPARESPWKNSAAPTMAGRVRHTTPHRANRTPLRLHVRGLLSYLRQQLHRRPDHEAQPRQVPSRRTSPTRTSGYADPGLAQPAL